MTEDNKIELYKGGVLSTVRKLTATVASPSSPDPDADVDLNYVVRVLREHYRTVLVSGIALMLPISGNYRDQGGYAGHRESGAVADPEHGS